MQFAAQFPDDNSCKVDLKQKRDKEGIICKKCECTKHYWLQDKYNRFLNRYKKVSYIKNKGTNIMQ